MDLEHLTSYLDDFLSVDKVRDYCPNGLQVQGRDEVSSIVGGVTASQALIDQAIQKGADAILVHHGYFWKGEAQEIVGMKRARLKSLLENDISLLAYHLPLDVHPELGNNAQLAKLLGFRVEGPLEPEERVSVGFVGCLHKPLTLEELGLQVSQKLNREPLLVSGGEHKIKTVGWCTGGAQGYIDKAIAQGLDAYVSGEISEPTVHAARENNIHYIAAGHHATERYGVQALGAHLQTQFDIKFEFVDIDNPA